MQTTNYKIYGDHLGGVTLETADDYVHYYDNMYLLAQDIKKLHAGETTANWDNNEKEELRDNQPDGKIRAFNAPVNPLNILDQDDIAALAQDYHNTPWINDKSLHDYKMYLPRFGNALDTLLSCLAEGVIKKCNM